MATCRPSGQRCVVVEEEEVWPEVDEGPHHQKDPPEGDKDTHQDRPCRKPRQDGDLKAVAEYLKGVNALCDNPIEDTVKVELIILEKSFQGVLDKFHDDILIYNLVGIRNPHRLGNEDNVEESSVVIVVIYLGHQVFQSQHEVNKALPHEVLNRSNVDIPNDITVNVLKSRITKILLRKKTRKKSRLLGYKSILPQVKLLHHNGYLRGDLRRCINWRRLGRSHSGPAKASQQGAAARAAAGVHRVLRVYDQSQSQSTKTTT